MEPDKAEVLAWEGGEMPARRAFAAIRRGAETFEAVVDLEAGTVESHRQVEGVESGILLEEWELAYTATVSDPPAGRRRCAPAANESFDELFCAPLSAGHFGEEEPHAGARILKVPCFDTEGAENNLWGRPIEGLMTIVDLGSGDVLDVVDTGVVPVPEEAARLRRGDGPARCAASRRHERARRGQLHHAGRRGLLAELVVPPALRPPGGAPSCRWCASTTARGPRSIAYQIALSEMFVPYMDADPGWYFRSYMDIGEYGFGLLSSELRPGVDCPEHATFLEATIAGDMGEPVTMPNVMCVFERPTGDPLWRHAEIIDGTYEGRPEVDLVVRTIPTVGNYDYVIDTVLTQRGGDRHRHPAPRASTPPRASRRPTMSDPTAEADTATGALVAPNVVAVYHDHYLSFRLDLDVDGPTNTLIREEIVPRRVEVGPRPLDLEPRGGRSSPRRAPWPERAHGEVWRVVNRGVETALGHLPGFQIEPGHGALSVLAPDDYPPGAGGLLLRAAVGHRAMTAPSSLRRATTRCRAGAATGCRSSSQTATRWRMPTSCCGTRWASTM